MFRCSGQQPFVHVTLPDSTGTCTQTCKRNKYSQKIKYKLFVRLFFSSSFVTADLIISAAGCTLWSKRASLLVFQVQLLSLCGVLELLNSSSFTCFFFYICVCSVGKAVLAVGGRGWCLKGFSVQRSGVKNTSLYVR